MKHRAFQLSFCLLAVSSSLGCGSGLVPVTGIVTLDGKPYEKARVGFLAEGQGEDAYGVTDSDGRFVLETTSRKGARPGSYRVFIVQTNLLGERRSAEGIQKSTAKREVPEVYESGKTSPLKVTLPHDGPILLELKKE